PSQAWFRPDRHDEPLEPTVESAAAFVRLKKGIHKGISPLRLEPKKWMPRAGRCSGGIGCRRTAGFFSRTLHVSSHEKPGGRKGYVPGSYEPGALKSLIRCAGSRQRLCALQM